MDSLGGFVELGDDSCGAADVIGAVLCKREGVFLVSIKGEKRLFKSVRQLLEIAQKIAAGDKTVFLPLLELCAFELCDGIAQAFAQTFFFRIIHAHLLEIAQNRAILSIFRGKNFCPALQRAEAIQITQVLPFVHELAAVVLTVDIDQKGGKLFHLRRCDRNAAYAAAAFPVRADPALEDQFVLFVDLVGAKPIRTVNPFKDRGNRTLLRAAAHQVAAYALAKHSPDGVDDDGFAGTGLASQYIEAFGKANVRPFDNGDIFNMQFAEHGLTYQSEELFDFTVEMLRSRCILERQKACIVPGERTHEALDLHGFDSAAGSRSQPRDSLDDEKILCDVTGNDALLEDFAETLVEIVALLLCCSIAVITADAEFLDQVHVLNITRKRRLGAADPALCKSLKKLLLCFDLPCGNDFQNSVLSFGLHGLLP